MNAHCPLTDKDCGLCTERKGEYYCGQAREISKLKECPLIKRQERKKSERSFKNIGEKT